MADSAALRSGLEAVVRDLARVDQELVHDLLQAVRTYTSAEISMIGRDRLAGRDVTGRLDRLGRLDAMRSALEREPDRRNHEPTQLIGEDAA
jgi:hypothetical protein